jgi:dienelactone hydrolase
VLGAADDYTPAVHCERYAAWFGAKGAPTEVAILADAHHGFDIAEPPQRLGDVQSARNCGLDIALEPIAGRRWDDGAPIEAAQIGDYLRQCMTRGATFGGNAAARGAAEAAVDRFLARTLLPGR